MKAPLADDLPAYRPAEVGNFSPGHAGGTGFAGCQGKKRSGVPLYLAGFRIQELPSLTGPNLNPNEGGGMNPLRQAKALTHSRGEFCSSQESQQGCRPAVLLFQGPPGLKILPLRGRPLPFTLDRCGHCLKAFGKAQAAPPLRQAFRQG